MGFNYLEGNCFVCGKNNPDGLQLDFIRNPGGTSEVRCTFEHRHQGYDNIVHGGLIAAVLDDSMAHAVMAIGLMPVTAEMKIRFKQPVMVGEEILFEGRVVSTGRRFVLTSSVATSPDGSVKVTAEGKFFVDVVEKWNPE